MAPKTGVQNLMAQTRQRAQANLEVRVVLRKGGNARMRVRDPNGKKVLGAPLLKGVSGVAQARLITLDYV